MRAVDSYVGGRTDGWMDDGQNTCPPLTGVFILARFADSRLYMTILPGKPPSSVLRMEHFFSVTLLWISVDTLLSSE